MKITHNNKTYIDAATHAGLRCWVNQALVEMNEKSDQLGPIGDYADDELIRYAHDPDGYRHGDILITDAEDHRKHWPMRNTHRHPLEVVGNGGGDAQAGISVLGSTEPRPVVDSIAPAPQPVDGDEWPTDQWYQNREHELVYFGDSVSWFHKDGDKGHHACCYSPEDPDLAPITPTQAAEWLRNNGHEAEAAKLEGDRFEPLGTLPVVGDVLWYRDGTDLRVNEIDVVDRYYYESRSASGFHRLSWSGFTEKGWRILKRRTGGNSKPTNPV